MLTPDPDSNDRSTRSGGGQDPLEQGSIICPAPALALSEITRIVMVTNARRQEDALLSLLATAIMHRSVSLAKGAGSSVEIHAFANSTKFGNSGSPLTAEALADSERRFEIDIIRPSRERTTPRPGQKIFVIGLDNILRIGRATLTDIGATFLAHRIDGNEIAGGVCNKHGESFLKAAELVRQYPNERLFFCDIPVLFNELRTLREPRLDDDQILLHLAKLFEDALEGRDSDALKGVSKVLEVVANSCSIGTIHHPEDRVDNDACMRDLILMLSSGEALPENLAALAERSDTARHDAERYLRSAEELAPGIVKLAWPVIGQKQLVGDSFIQVSTLVKSAIDDQLAAASDIKVVLYWSPDQRPTAITVQEGEELERMLANGDAIRVVFDKMISYLAAHGDRLRLSLLHLSEMRGADLEEKIKQEINRSKYIPDPEGSYYLAKCPQEIDREAIFRMAESELDSFDCGWLISFGEGGGAQRMSYSFQAKYLDSVVKVLSRYV